jgi:hypothetical protein
MRSLPDQHGHRMKVSTGVVQAHSVRIIEKAQIKLLGRHEDLHGFA